MMNYKVRGEKSFLAYSCMITQIYLAEGVQFLLGINEILEAMNTTNLGLIRDTTNPLAR